MVKSLLGQRFGMLTVVSLVGKKLIGKNYKYVWLCKCDCGNTKEIVGSYLTSGQTKSCGCIHHEMMKNLNRKHGYSHKERLYSVWKAMKGRCSCENDKSYKNYGARGITVCKEWAEDYGVFRSWAYSHGYKEETLSNGLNKWTIDRIDNDKGYCPENCRWVTNLENARNRRKLNTPVRLKTCQYCGKTFEITKCQSNKKFCSKECVFSSKKKNSFEKHTKECPVCHRKFIVTGGHFNRRICCSKECSRLRNSKVWSFDGKSLTVVEWAELTNMTSHCLLHRHNDLGWSIEKCLTTPLRRKNG